MTTSVVRQGVKNSSQRSALRQDGYRWQGLGGDVGRFLSRLPPPMALEFSPEQMWYPTALLKGFRKVCPDAGSARDLQLAKLSEKSLDLLPDAQEANPDTRSRHSFLSELRESGYQVVSHKASTWKDFPRHAWYNLLSLHFHASTIP